MWNTILRALLGQAGPLLAMIVGGLTNRKLFDQVLTLAQLEVAKLEGDQTKDGDAKRAAAFEAIVSSLKAIGAIVAPILINLAIEIAVSALRAQAAKKS